MNSSKPYKTYFQQLLKREQLEKNLPLDSIDKVVSIVKLWTGHILNETFFHMKKNDRSNIMVSDIMMAIRYIIPKSLERFVRSNAGVKVNKFRNLQSIKRNLTMLELKPTLPYIFVIQLIREKYQLTAKADVIVKSNVMVYLVAAIEHLIVELLIDASKLASKAQETDISVAHIDVALNDKDAGFFQIGIKRDLLEVDHDEFFKELIPEQLTEMPGIEDFIRKRFHHIIGEKKVKYYYSTDKDDTEACEEERDANDEIEDLFRKLLIMPSPMTGFGGNRQLDLYDDAEGDFCRWGSQEPIEDDQYLRKFITILKDLDRIELVEIDGE